MVAVLDSCDGDPQETQKDQCFSANSIGLLSVASRGLSGSACAWVRLRISLGAALLNRFRCFFHAQGRR